MRPGRNYRSSVAFKALLTPIHTYGEVSTCLAEIKIDIRPTAKCIGGLIERPNIGQRSDYDDAETCHPTPSACWDNCDPGHCRHGCMGHLFVSSGRRCRLRCPSGPSASRREQAARARG